MGIQVDCPMCGQPIRADAEYVAAQEVACSSCGESFTYPGAAVRRISMAALVPVGAFALWHVLAAWSFWADGSDYTVARTFHLIGLPVYACAFWLYFRKWMPSIAVSIVMFIGILCWQMNTGYYRETVEKDGMTIVTKYSRWTDLGVYRWVWQNDIDMVTEGPLHPDGILHRRWITTAHEPEYFQEIDWYWHGELVTEAEFHRRELGE